MREIKYRVYGGLLEKEFKAYDNVLLSMEGGVLRIKPCDWHGRGDDVVLEPYTGLEDKNGKEICVGDVVSEHQGDIVGEIVQKPSGEYRIAWIGIYGGESVLYDHHLLCEVVGNIHDNPELLEAKAP